MFSYVYCRVCFYFRRFTCLDKTIASLINPWVKWLHVYKFYFYSMIHYLHRKGSYVLAL